MILILINVATVKDGKFRLEFFFRIVFFLIFILFSLKLAGPLWLGKIHDEAFVKLVIDHIEADRKNK